MLAYAGCVACSEPKSANTNTSDTAAIARAIFAESPVLLLDEATSALDGETEKRLLKNLRRLTDKTVVIVTHRPAALTICDRVLRFTENGVEEKGSHRQLIAKNGLYNEMYQMYSA